MLHGPPIVTDALRDRLQATWIALVAEDGDLGIPADAFCDQVQRTLSTYPVEEQAQVLDRLVLRDVHLVLGCLAGAPRALRLFMTRFRPYLRHLSLRHSPSEAIAEDVEALLLATLFTPRRADDPTSARLYSYQGMGTLQGWLRVTARRQVIDILRKQKPQASEGVLDRLASPGRGAERDLMHLEAAARLRPVLSNCVSQLSDDERSLLSQYYRDGRVLREIGDDLGIDTSSVFRRLGTARSKVWKRFRSKAREELGLDDRDLRGLLGSIADDLNLDDLFATAMVLAFL